MALADLFASEDRVEVKFSHFYALMKEATKAELLMNGTICDTPHAYMREMMTGKREEDAHTHSDMTIHIKPIISGIDIGEGESESPLPWGTPGQDETEPEEDLDPELDLILPNPEDGYKPWQIDKEESEG